MMAAVEADRAGAVAAPARRRRGAAMPQIGSCVRARWSHLVADKAQLQTAFAFEAVVDEAVFIVGPALVTVLATTVHPLAGLGAAVRRRLVGTAVLVVAAAHRAAARPGRPRGTRGGPMPWRVLAPLVACAFAMGVLLGGAEVATVAFSDEHGAKPRCPGLLLAHLGAGQPAVRGGHRRGAPAGRERDPLPLGDARARRC